jgi:twitching motility protein PilJ
LVATGPTTAADRVGRDVVLFGRVVRAFLNGDAALELAAVNNAEARARLEQIAELYGQLVGHVDDILQRAPALFEGLEAAGAVAGGSATLFDASHALARATRYMRGTRVVDPPVGYALGALAVVCAFMIGSRRRSEGLKRLAETTERNRRSQEAILRLLDEMGDLADGDLTVQAVVTEELTGAIADSVNYTIEALRELVATINDTAVEVSKAVQLTQHTAAGLVKSSERQSREIAEAGAVVEGMASAIGEISSSASESAKVAESAVAIAYRGAAAVDKNIRGMDVIREQIQETAKRIKRLGESSQQIGDIVGLIDDIADQTNILALNAAIQAATAGEAGRGFAVVADEVQRLAERSGSATKQIENLVRTIQADTQEAVLSMERTTANVVAGTTLASDAGGALQEIQRVSKHLEDLVQGFAQTAQDQAAAADRVRATMDLIREMTQQTSAGTESTAGSIGRLAELAARLRTSVAGFKLPA